MAAELVQQQSMRQEQTMTHHQIQALEMLFAPVTELSSIITGEIEKNPVLEVEAESYEKLEIEDVNDNDISHHETDEWVEKILQIESRSSFGQTTFSSSQEDENKRHFLDSLTTHKTLHDHLNEQLAFLGLDEATRTSCETVISGLDDDGYLTSHPADLAMVTGENINNIKDAVKIIQKLDPAGVGAMDLKERLLLQLERENRQDSLVYQTINLYLDDIAANRLPKVAKAMQLTMTELHQIISEIKNLNPHLSDNLPILPHNYIEEEVEIIENFNGQLKVKINNGRLPSLKISPYYKKMLEDPNLNKEAKDYIKSKINGGIFLINSLIQRQSTIEKISNAICKEQESFFKQGLNFLKPLTMSQIAEASSVHETTVSRAVSGKYLKCKFGLFPLRFFFTPGYTSASGDSISNATVKKAIKELIEKEDSRKPLSDSQIASLLKKQGLDVARRTVAKYRESLSVLPSNLRRQY